MYIAVTTKANSCITVYVYMTLLTQIGVSRIEIFLTGDRSFNSRLFSALRACDQKGKLRVG